MRVNEEAECLPPSAWRLTAALRAAIAALERGCALTPRERTVALAAARRALEASP